MKRNNIRILLFVFGLYYSFTSQVKAEESQKQAPLFNSDIFSLSKKKEDSFDVASATYIISSEDIRRSGATTVPETLRLVPGVQVAKNDNNSWSISIRGFNAQYANKLLVMIDGRTVYTTLFSGVFWDTQDYPLNDIERIEVVKGPGGTIWGANAVNGVINIITKSASLTQGGSVSALAGNYDNSGDIRYGGKTADNNYYRIYGKQSYRRASSKASNGTSNHDSYHDSRAGFRYDVKSVANSEITVSGDVSNTKSQNYFGTLNSFTSAHNDKNSDNANLLANWNKNLSKKSSFNLQTYFDYNRLDINVLDVTTKTFDFDFQHFYDLNKRNQLISGLGYRLISDTTGGTPLSSGAGAGLKAISYDPISNNNNVFSAFLQDKIGILIDKLYLTLGSKFENNSYTGFLYQPNARLTYYPSENQTAWASVSRAVRTPSRGDDGINVKSGVNGATITAGNHGYDSEELIAYELGYRIKPSKTILFDIAAFFNDYTNLRTFENISSVPTAYNFGYGTSHGFEFDAKWQATKDWRLEVGYSFLKMNIHTKSYSTDTGPLAEWYVNRSSPRNQFIARSNYNITSKIEFDNTISYISGVPDARTSARSSTAGAVPSYFRFDTKIAYLPVKNLELSLVGQNLTDDRHQEFKEGLNNNQTEVGRAFYFKVLYGF